MLRERDPIDDQDQDEPTPTARPFMRVVRFVSMGLYFLMLATAVGALGWGWSVSGKLEEANAEIARLKDENRELRIQLRELQVDEVIGVESGAGTVVPETVRRPMNTSPRIAPPVSVPKTSRVVDLEDTKRLERERDEQAKVIALLMARNAELERANLLANGAHPPAEDHRTAAQIDEARQIAALWNGLLADPSDAESKVKLSTALGAMSDDAALIWLDAHSGPESSATLMGLEMLRIRSPKGGDTLARALLGKARQTAGYDKVAEAVLQVAESYRTEVSRDTVFRLASDHETKGETRARALFGLAMSDDARAGQLMGDVFGSLAAGSPQRVELIKLAVMRKDDALLDAVLAALADVAATESELAAASETAKTFHGALKARLMTLADALQSRGMDASRVRLVRELAAGSGAGSPETPSAASR